MLMLPFRRSWTGIAKGGSLFFCVWHTCVKKLMVVCYDRVFGIFWKCARMGERLSPYVSLCCVVMAVRTPPPIQKLCLAAETHLCRPLWWRAHEIDVSPGAGAGFLLLQYRNYILFFFDTLSGDARRVTD